MKKLELKHLAAYLPYEPKFYRQGEKLNFISLTNDSIWLGKKTGNRTETYGGEPFNECILILRPLSDLTTKSEFENFKYNSEIFHLINYGYKKCNYEFVEKLLELHFDIFGLIENDLAIDINTLKL